MPPPRALVVFTDQHDLPWQRWLEPGFRHCFVVVRDPDDEWIACDWLKGRFAFRAYGPCDVDELVERFVRRGHRVAVVRGPGRSSVRPWLRLLTCVEVAKQCLGMSGLRPLTPFGLFRALAAHGSELHPTKD